MTRRETTERELAEGIPSARIDEISAGPDEDSFSRPILIIRDGTEVGWLDNSGSDIRVKAAEGASSELINYDNDGLEVTPSGKISLGGTDIGDMPTYADDTAPPNDTLFYDTADAQMEYNDPSGTNHPLG